MLRVFGQAFARTNISKVQVTILQGFGNAFKRLRRYNSDVLFRPRLSGIRATRQECRVKNGPVNHIKGGDFHTTILR